MGADTGGGTSYPMAQKTKPWSGAAGDDGKMCWAATASDLIEYWQQRYVHETGQPLPAGVPSGSADSLRQSQVFDTFVKYWKNTALGVEPGFYWYFNGLVAASQPEVSGGGGYWKDYCAQLGYAQPYDELRQNSYCDWIHYSVPTQGSTSGWQAFVNQFDSFVADSLQGGLLSRLIHDPAQSRR